MNQKIKNSILIVLAFGAGIFLGRSFFVSAGSDESSHLHTEAGPAEATIWTCSMHPQIQQPESGLCPICGMELIPLETGGRSDPFSLTMTESAVRLADIRTTKIGRGSEESASMNSWLINGKILPDERQIYSQPPHINGRIESLFVTYEGMYIQQGSKIADIYSPEIIAAQREFLEALKLKDVSPRMIEAARNKLKFLKIPETFIEELEETGKVVETFPLLAEKSGYVLNKNVEVGDHVDDGQILFDIYNLNSLWAVFDVYEKDISKIRVGDVVEFTVTALPGQTFRTRIDFINPLLDRSTRAVQVRGQIDNSRQRLKPQMLIRGHLTINSKSGTGEVLVPRTAVLWTGRESVVYVRDTTIDIPAFTFREITLGPAIGGFYKVLAGLEPGEEVVTNGVFAVDASAQLNNQNSMVHRMAAEDMGLAQKASVQIKRVDADLVTPGARADLKKVLEGYIRLKNDMVESDEARTKVSVGNLEKILSELKERQDLGAYSEVWNNHLRDFGHQLDLLSKDSKLKDWRQDFVAFSAALIHWMTEFGNPTETEVYIQRCPMANHDQGADWLSFDQDIRNPYYGDAMMTCGMIEETL